MKEGKNWTASNPVEDKEGYVVRWVPYKKQINVKYICKSWTVTEMDAKVKSSCQSMIDNHNKPPVRVNT